MIQRESASFTTREFSVSWLSDIGRRRQINQDYAGTFPELRLFIVADGMGGHRGGEIASQMAVQIIGERFGSELSNHPSRSPREILTHSTFAANQAILTRARKEVELEGMGTTVTSLHFDDGHAFVAHVGDSRCYLLRPEGIWQLTRDHSLVQDKLRAGMITREQLKTDRMKNVITRSVGFDLNFGIDVYTYTPKAGDIFLLCSDGLSGHVEDSEMHSIVMESAPAAVDSLTPAVDRLIELANSRGGEDNITVMLVQYTRD